MNNLNKLFQQLIEHLDFTYDVHQIKDGIVVNSPFTDYLDDQLNIYISLNQDHSLLLFDDDNHTNSEFNMYFGHKQGIQIQNYEFKNDPNIETILTNNHIVPAHDQTLITDCPTESNFTTILNCIHDLEAVQIAMFNYLSIKLQVD